MCHPAVVAAVTVASSAASAVQARSAAKQQEAFTNTQLDRRADQEAISTRGQLFDVGMKALNRAGTALVGGAEAGVSGESPVRELGEIQNRLAMGGDRVRTNYDFASQNISTARQGAAVTRSVNTPNPFSTGLRIAAAGYSGYATGKELFS